MVEHQGRDAQRGCVGQDDGGDQYEWRDECSKQNNEDPQDHDENDRDDRIAVAGSSVLSIKLRSSCPANQRLGVGNRVNLCPDVANCIDRPL